ncbi:MAG: hypothetical protein K6G16_03830 [Lachnospiraceae bacterium]|nr:hypothetical protein [Lachnospiraceae bacterium]
MKQIIIATSDREKIEKEIGENRDIHVSWCDLTIEGIQSIRDRSNTLFLCLRDEDEDELKKIALYLRDLCIEDEKILYLYGNRVSVDLISARVPSLFVHMAVYMMKMPFSRLLDDLDTREQETAEHRPTLLILDDNTEYIEKLRVMLDSSFRVYVSHYDLHEAGLLLLRADIVLLGMDVELSMIKYMQLFRALAKKMRQPGFHFYFLTSSKEDRDLINSSGDRAGVAFTRDMEPARVAEFLKNVNVPAAPAASAIETDPWS